MSCYYELRNKSDMALVLTEFSIIGHPYQRMKRLTISKTAKALRAWDRSNWYLL